MTIAIRTRGVVFTALLAAASQSSSGQHLRRTDANAQDDLASRGFASDMLCAAANSDPLPGLEGSPEPFAHFAASATASAGSHSTAHAQLRAHLASGCRSDGSMRIAAGSEGAVGTGALAVLHQPALGGALHLFLEAGLARDSAAADRLDLPRGAELGLGYTTFNLLELVPFFRSPEGHPRLDIRARLSGGALYEYAGDARRLHGKSIVPEYSVTTGLVVHERINVALLYTARVIPGFIAPASATSNSGRTLWEHSLVLDHAVLSGVESRLSAYAPFVGVRYSRRELGALDKRHELAAHAGFHFN